MSSSSAVCGELDKTVMPFSSATEPANSSTPFLPPNYPPMSIGQSNTDLPEVNMESSHGISHTPASQSMISTSVKQGITGTEASSMEKSEEVGDGSTNMVLRELRYVWITNPSSVIIPFPPPEKQIDQHVNSDSRIVGMEVEVVDGRGGAGSRQPDLLHSDRRDGDIGKEGVVMLMEGVEEKEETRAVLEEVGGEEGGKEGEPMINTGTHHSVEFGF